MKRKEGNKKDLLPPSSLRLLRLALAIISQAEGKKLNTWKILRRKDRRVCRWTTTSSVSRLYMQACQFSGTVGF